MRFLEDTRSEYEKFLSQINPNSTPIEKVKAYLNCHERDWVIDQK